MHNKFLGKRMIQKRLIHVGQTESEAGVSVLLFSFRCGRLGDTIPAYRSELLGPGSSAFDILITVGQNQISSKKGTTLSPAPFFGTSCWHYCKLSTHFEGFEGMDLVLGFRTGKKIYK
jgi:hypothetical protein